MTYAERAEARISEVEAAERIARDEAAGLRAERDDLRAVLDARQEWGLRRPMRWR
jgi:hypothetical protein